MILAIPMKSRPGASNVTNRPVVNRGNAKTATPNISTKTTRPIFQI
jgi:hypothetical protein